MANDAKVSSLPASALRYARTFLFAPADRPNNVQNALDSAADAIIADLEDGVAPSRKGGARAALAEVFGASRKDREPMRFVRINSEAAGAVEADLHALDDLRIDGLVVPKASTSSISRLAHLGLPLIALIESGAGLRDAFAIASNSQVEAVALGTVDLSRELGFDDRRDGHQLLFARSQLVRDCAAARLRPPIDGVRVELDRLSRLAAEARLAASLGMRGKLCIHPRQLETVRRAFAVDPARIEWAERVIAAARNTDGAAFRIDGEMVDAAVVSMAERVIDEART
jgi:citrate lyase subunit beta/citryl-CoA lyase